MISLLKNTRISIYSCSSCEESDDNRKWKGEDIHLSWPHDAAAVGVWCLLFCAWPWNSLLSLPFSQQLSSYKPRSWQALEAMTWEEKQEKSRVPDRRPKGQLLGDISISHKKVSPKEFLLDCATEDLNCVCTSQPRDTGHHSKLLQLVCVKMSSWAFGPESFQGTHL